MPTQTTINDLPEWLQGPYQDLISGGQAVTSQPYTPYSGQRLEGFSPDQLASFDAARQAAGSGSELLGDAAGSFQSGLGSLTGTGGDFANMLSQLGISGDFLNQGGGLLGGAAGNLTTAQNQLGSAAGTGQQALSSLQSGISGLPLAQGLTAGSARGVPGSDISQYMSPYIKNALDPAAREINRSYDLQDQALGSQAAQNNAFGGSRQAVLEGVQDRHRSESIGNLYAGGLERAYQSGIGALQGDLGRELQAGGQLGQLGSVYGGLGQGMTNLMGGQGSLADSYRNIAGTQGGLAGVYGGLAGTGGSLAGQYGDLAGARTGVSGAYGDLAAGIGGLGAQTQQMGLEGAQALGDIGTYQQQFGQQNLDVAYQDFLNQQDYPYQQLQFMQGVLGGWPSAVGTSTQQTPDPSGGSQILGGISTGIGIADDLFDFFG